MISNDSFDYKEQETNQHWMQTGRKENVLERTVNRIVSQLAEILLSSTYSALWGLIQTKDTWGRTKHYIIYIVFDDNVKHILRAFVIQ